MFLNKKGFTLLELLAVLALITVVSAVSAPKIINTIKTTNEQKVDKDMQNIASALQRFCLEQELKSGNPESCKLNDIAINSGEWHGANQNLQSLVISEAIAQYLEEKVDKQYTVIISVDEGFWLNKNGYGSVSVWYPSLTETGQRYYFGNAKITSFKANSYTQQTFKGLNDSDKTLINSFILDIDGDGKDSNNDFLIKTAYFKLNSTHPHTSNVQKPIEGSNDDDILHGTKYEDIMYGYAGNDTIYGYDSNDEIYGGNDSDLIFGGKGNDLIDGGEGIDTAVYSGSYTEYIVTGDNPYIITGLGETDSLSNIEYLKFSDMVGEITEFINIDDTIYGTEGNDDPLNGTDESDIIYALAGNDVIYAKDKNDTVYAGEGHDIITGGLGNDSLYGGEGNDTAIYSGVLSEYTISGLGPYTITGPEGEDTLTDIENLTFADISGTIEHILNSSGNIIYGTENDDNELMGTPNKDIIYAYAGNDTIYGLASNDKIDGGEGTDTAVFSSYFVYYTIEGDEPKLINGPDGADTLISIEKLRFKDEDFYQDDFEDTVRDIITGTDNDDELDGSFFGADIFVASKGHDVIKTRWGIDTIVFGSKISDYTIYEGQGFEWSYVSDNNGNITYFRSLFKTKLQFTDTVYYAG